MISILELEYPEIFEQIRENRCAIKYEARSRTFKIVSCENPTYQVIKYCPWSGKPLPKELFEELIARLDEQNRSIEDLDDDDILSGEGWWLDAGL